MTIDVARLVPHAGAMCLLDRVVDWRADRIHCRACIESVDRHPLAGTDGLPATALIEYAAQAVAAHGSLVAGAAGGASARVAGGRLVALRGVDLTAGSAAIEAGRVLDIHAERIVADPTGSIYAFRVLGGIGVLVRGRLTVRMLDPEPA